MKTCALTRQTWENAEEYHQCPSRKFDFAHAEATKATNHICNLPVSPVNVDTPVILGLETPYDTKTFTPIDNAVVTPLVFPLSALCGNPRLALVFGVLEWPARDACDDQLLLAPAHCSPGKFEQREVRFLLRGEEK